VPGLVEMDVVIDSVLTSPLVRARETAQLLAAGLKPKPAIIEVDALAPGGRHQAIIEAIKTHAKRHRRLALVGHEPDLGEFAARLLAARGNIEFKKGAVCLIEVDGATPGGPGTLRWMLTPRALRALVR
jgi:phosphohistidine phosphatase